MVPKEDAALDEDHSLGSECTSESSDSYFYLLRDIENPSNQINEEWEAIERTLYQEDGRHVTDPALIKECKLWRETFPHLRVRGTSVNPEDLEQSNKGVQAVDTNQLPLSKLSEKRDKIKKTVVSQIVDRLITKFSSNKENSDAELIQVEEEKPGMKGSKIERESYFERGKEEEVPDSSYNFHQALLRTTEGTESKDTLTNLFENFECNFTVDPGRGKTISNTTWSGVNPYMDRPPAKEYTSNLAKNEEILRSNRLSFKITERSGPIRLKTEKSTDSLASLSKPFELTKKIDPKYGGMLERILENKRANFSGRSPKAEVRSYRETTARSGLLNQDDYPRSVPKKSKQLPKINNFTNNWMARAEQHDQFGESFERMGYGDIVKNARNQKSHSCRSETNQYQFDEKFLEELKKEMWSYKNGHHRRGDCDQSISMTRPQLQHRLAARNTARTQKSSSCGDLPKKNPKTNSRSLKSGMDTGKGGLVVKNGPKKKTAKSQNLLLPPIETSIICTEIVGRPKAPTRTLPKKYS